MSSRESIFKHFSFFLCYALLFAFILTTSTHEYEYMLNEARSEFTSWCQLPMEKDSARREMYIVFIFLSGVAGFVFLKKKNPVLIFCMLVVFCYATYAFILKDMMCSTF